MLNIKIYSPANIGPESLTSDKSICDIWLASTMGIATLNFFIDLFVKLHGNGMTIGGKGSAILHVFIQYICDNNNNIPFAVP